MNIKRSSGLLMHITSLPGKHGIGTMGAEARHFIDLLKEGGQKYWQVLPFGPVSSTFGYSPYSALSSFAGNFFFINLNMMQKEDWMRNYIMSDLPEDGYADFVDFNRIASFKIPLLQRAAQNFFKYAQGKDREEFDRFCETEASWLDDYSLFVPIAEHYNNYNWLAWDEDIRLRKPAAIKKFTKELTDQIDYNKFVQFIFYKQWDDLKAYANQKGIKIIGDIPIYVNFDSAEAWANPEIFQLDPHTYKPVKVAGVPPDYFSPTGQRWGNPLYVWWDNGKLKKETVSWWIRRFKHVFTHFDITRLDHFRGFEAYWAVPASEVTAINGSWEKGPGVEFFKILKKELSDMPIFAEDLGVITPQVEKLRDKFKFPGMKILQFAFDFNNKNPYLPHNFQNPSCIVYTGTHDNSTTNGWFYEESDERTRLYVMDYLKLNHRDEFHWQLINLALSSIAQLSIIPIQDILGYAGRFRMNTPGRIDNNWRWKLTPERLSPEIMHKLKKLCIMYNRA